VTTREVKAYLRQYRGSIDRTRETTEHLDELKSEAVRLKDHEGQKVALDDAVQKYVDACNDAAVYLDMLSDLRRKIESEIESVSEPKLQTVLRMRYISGKTFEQIAVDMNKSWRHTVRLHGAAILEIKKILECH
jgi:DNA-directed RNA polymerase specialized sigma subunit